MRWIADIGSNHNVNLDRALKLIYEAHRIGCTDVKFQLFNGEIGKPEKEWLPTEWLPKLSEWAHFCKLGFGCTPFYLDAVKILKPHVDFYKLTSNYDVVSKFFHECIWTKRPIICSLPPNKLETKPCLHRLAAVPLYPTPLDKVHLGDINWDIADGWSDHTRTAGVLYSAVFKYGVKVIEFHLDLEDGKGWEYHYGHCWLPEEIKVVIDNVRQGKEAD
jgi:sialic acid synthase SpsE